mmetsp:Transcript_40882/g.128095  ORF Transcript_40882/g.128095 Transcript_40882/m.128095 type:complete len:201 (+) Transcript_40882:4997-5599(+)
MPSHPARGRASKDSAMTPSGHPAGATGAEGGAAITGAPASPALWRRLHVWQLSSMPWKSTKPPATMNGFLLCLHPASHMENVWSWWGVKITSSVPTKWNSSSLSACGAWSSGSCSTISSPCTTTKGAVILSAERSAGKTNFPTTSSPPSRFSSPAASMVTQAPQGISTFWLVSTLRLEKGAQDSAASRSGRLQSSGSKPA